MQRQHSSQATSTLGNTPNLNIGFLHQKENPTQRSYYTPKHLGRRSSKPTKLKLRIFLRLLTRVKNKASLYSMGCTACKQTY